MNENPMNQLPTGGDPVNSTPPTPLRGGDKTAIRTFSRVGVALIVLLVMTTLGQTVLLVIPELLGYADVLNTWWYSIVLSTVPLYALALPTVYLVLRTLPKAAHNETYLARQPDGTRASAEKPRLTVGWFALIALVAWGFTTLGGQIGDEVMAWISAWMQYDHANGLVSLTDSAPLWASALLMAVIAPIGEELIFRKLFIDRMRGFGDATAIGVSALFFALFHGNLYQFFYAFLTGWLLGYIYTRTGKLRWSIALHAVINCLGGVIPLLLQSLVDMDALQSADLEIYTEAILQNPGGYLLLFLFSQLVLGAMVASVVLAIVLRRRLKLGQGTMPLPRGERFGLVMGNAGMLVAFVLYLLVLALALVPAG